MIKFVIIVAFEPVMSRLLRVVHTALKQDFNVFCYYHISFNLIFLNFFLFNFFFNLKFIKF